MRLIDADALERHVYTEWVNGELSNSEWVDFRQWLKDEPTVEPASPWHTVEDGLPDEHTRCLVSDADGMLAVGYYRYDCEAWDSPAFGFIEAENRIYIDDIPMGIGKVVKWKTI